MSHYTIGTGSSVKLQRYARQANRARSIAVKKAFLALIRAFFPQHRAKRALSRQPTPGYSAPSRHNDENDFQIV